MFVDTVRFDNDRLHLDSGGSSIFVDLFWLSGDKNKALVTSEADTSDGACRYRSTKSIIGVDSPF